MKLKQKNDDGDRLYHLHDIAQVQVFFVLDHSSPSANIWKTQTFQTIFKLLATCTLGYWWWWCVFVNVPMHMYSF